QVRIDRQPCVVVREVVMLGIVRWHACAPEFSAADAISHTAVLGGRHPRQRRGYDLVSDGFYWRSARARRAPMRRAAPMNRHAAPITAQRASPVMKDPPM